MREKAAVILAALLLSVADGVPAAAQQLSPSQSDLPADIIAAAQGVDAQSEREDEVVQLLGNEPLIKTEAVIIGGKPEIAAPEVKHRAAEVIKKTGDGWSVRVRLEPGDRAPGAVLTVIGTTAAGTTVSSRVADLRRPEQLLVPESRRCQLDTATARLDVLLGLDEKKLVRLIEIRKRQKNALTALLAKTMSPEMFEKLAALEKELGLNNNEPINAEMSNERLAERLGTIHTLLSQRAKQ